jgi:hypothetical protein
VSPEIDVMVPTNLCAAACAASLGEGTTTAIKSAKSATKVPAIFSAFCFINLLSHIPMTVRLQSLSVSVDE